MTITFALQPSDMKAFMSYNRRHRPSIKRARYFALLLFAILSANRAIERYHDTTGRIIGFCANFLVYAVCTWLVYFVLLRISLWRSLTPKEQPGLFCEHTITLTDDELIEVTAINESRHLWSGIHSVVETARHIFILVAANAAYVIPKSAFSTKEAAHEFFERAKFLYAKGKKSL